MWQTAERPTKSTSSGGFSLCEGNQFHVKQDTV